MYFVNRDEINCAHCRDSGVCFVDIQGTELLMRCDCPVGKKESWELPIWNGQTRKAFPSDWFKPKQQLASYFSNSIVSQWKAKIKVAIEYWENAT